MKYVILIIGFSFLEFSGYSQRPGIQFLNPNNRKGVGLFESLKTDTASYDGLQVRVGGNFALQFQNLSHSNTSAPVLNSDGVDVNALREIGAGFNLATANLNLDVQLEDGIVLNITTYLSSRHHPEAWVKGGFLQIDRMVFLGSGFINKMMNYLTVKVGHMEINYGDAHFRRTDNGNAFFNPFVGNWLMDAFTTEIGGEIYVKHKGIIAMGGITGGEIKGDVTRPGDRHPSLYGKAGFDRLIGRDLRLRLTGSFYSTAGSVSNTLYSGDRAGSRYYSVMDNTLTAGFTSGRINPGFSDQVTAMVVNPFIKWRGLELFVNIEKARGSSSTETAEREWTQMGGEIVYRFGKGENFYVGSRYQEAKGQLAGSLTDVTINRLQVGAGIFVTRNILAKVEFVDQEYHGYPSTSVFSGGRFKGVMVEGAIAF